MDSEVIQKIKNFFVGYQTERWIEFKNVLGYWRKKPYRIEEFISFVEPIFNETDYSKSFFTPFYDNLSTLFPKEHAKALAVKALREEEHRQACDAQSGSKLLTLPREIRDRIWEEAVTGNIIHVTCASDQPSKRKRKTHRSSTTPKRKQKFTFHACNSPLGLKSSASPPGQGDHSQCTTSGPSDYPNINLVCKQMYHELPELTPTIFSKDAFQFADLETAEEYLFQLDEDQRASISHLRIAIPFALTTAGTDQGWRQHTRFSGDGPNVWNSWMAICNYFSNPWDRETLRMTPHERDPSWMIKEPVYFYYSHCYYNHNRERLYSRYQVGRGDTSWDVGISDLIYKGCPKLDLAMQYPTEEELSTYLAGNVNHPLETFRFNPQGWIKPLLQFRNYEGLDFRMVGAEGKKTKFYDEFIREVKEHVGRMEVGPAVVPFFAGRPYGDGNELYSNFMR